MVWWYSRALDKVSDELGLVFQDGCNLFPLNIILILETEISVMSHTFREQVCLSSSNHLSLLLSVLVVMKFTKPLLSLPD